MHSALQDKAVPLVAREDSRDIYAVDEHHLLVVFTDRVYAHGVKLNAPLPGKGIMLNQISNFWMNRFTHLTANHVRFPNIADFPSSLQPHAHQLAGRSAVVRKVKALPFRFLTVGSLGGAYFKEYREHGTVLGYNLPKGMPESAWLEQSLFLPLPANDDAGKPGDGRRLAQRLLGQKLYASIEEICLSIFGVARNYALARGLTIADARFSFAVADGAPCLMHEVMTPDVATYWPGEVEPGQTQPVYERQNLYSWLKLQRWTPGQPVPDLPAELLKATLPRYRQVTDIMTGKVETLKKQDEALLEDDEEVEG